MKNKRWLPVSALLFFISVASLLTPLVGPGSSAGGLSAGDTAWMLTATALVLLMTPGLAFFYGGMVRTKNVISTMFQSFVAMGVISVLWVVVGFSLSFGDSIGGVIGNPLTFAMFRNVSFGSHPSLSPTIPLALFAFFQLKFAIITPALISGAFAERINLPSYLLFICLFSIGVYCPLAHMTWHPEGLLRGLGVLDFAGGTVVHMSAGLAALAGAMVTGRRNHAPVPPGKTGRRVSDLRPDGSHLPANIPFVLLGTGLLWFGWFGFNAGSSLAANGIAATALLTTNTAAASAMMVWLLLDNLWGKKTSALGACIGAVIGLVAITPAAGYVSIGASIFIGGLATTASKLAIALTHKFRLDDTLDVFACHGVGGMTGMLATGIFATKQINETGADGLFYGGYSLFGIHLAALCGVSAFSFIGSYALFKLTNLVLPLRVPRDMEEKGLDLALHGETIELSRSVHP